MIMNHPIPDYVPEKLGHQPTNQPASNIQHQDPQKYNSHTRTNNIETLSPKILIIL